VRFAFIAVEKATYPVRVLCRVLEVSRAGFYAWHTRPPARRTQQDQRLGVEIQAIHAESRQRYGSPRVHAELRERGGGPARGRGARGAERAHGLRQGERGCAPNECGRARRAGGTLGPHAKPGCGRHTREDGGGGDRGDHPGSAHPATLARRPGGVKARGGA